MEKPKNNQISTTVKFDDPPSELDNMLNALFDDEDEGMIGLTDSCKFPVCYTGGDTDIGSAKDLSWGDVLDDDDIAELVNTMNATEYTNARIQETDLDETVPPGSPPDLMPEAGESRAQRKPEPVLRLADVLKGALSAEKTPADRTRKDADDIFPSEKPDGPDARPVLPEVAIEVAAKRYILKKYSLVIEEMVAKTLEQKVIHEIGKLKLSVLENEVG